MRRPKGVNGCYVPPPTVVQKVWFREVLDLLIRRECACADRNGREFSLVLFRVKSEKKASVSTQRLARTILSRARLTDEVGWFSDNYICALLPDTAVEGARIFTSSVCDLVERKAPRPLAVVYSYPGNMVTSGEVSEAARPRGDRFKDQDDDDRSNGGNGGGRLQLTVNPRITGNSVRNAATVMRTVASGVSRLEETVEAAPSAFMTRSDLMPALKQGLKTELSASQLPANSIHEFLVHPIPMWKRMLDIIGAATALLVFSPVMLIVAIGIKLTSNGGPVLFTQNRAGLGGKPFKIYKFRTMVVDAEAKKQSLRALSEQDGPAFKLANDPRITPFGRLLRKTSLDELPQLWNVLVGDMSLVGPRPLPIEEAERCLQWQRRRLDVTPGLTCIWQVKGRSTVTFAEWIRMDVEYIRRRTIIHDLSLLMMTVPAVLLRKGAR